MTLFLYIEPENCSCKIKGREPLWLLYLLGEQNSINVNINDVKYD